MSITLSPARPFARITPLHAAIGLALPLLPAVIRLVGAHAAKAAATTAPLTEGTRWFEPGQCGVTYEDVLVPYLTKEAALTVVDSHIKSFRQIRNLRELILAVASHPDGGPHDVHIVTARATGGLDWEYGQAKALIALQEELVEHGITLRVSFDESNHDRWIETSGWRVLLGKGLDFWDAKSCHDTPQELRSIAKRFAITYCLTDK